MKIAYHAYWNIGLENGVSKKIARQMRFWLARGHEVVLYALTPLVNIATCFDGLTIRPYPLASRLDFFRTPAQIIHDLQDWRPDVLYTRFNKYYPPLHRVRTIAPFVLEINTNDLAEYRLNSSWPVYAYHLLTRDLALKNCSGMVFLAEGTANHYRHYGKPYRIIGDSISLDDYPIYPPATNDRPRLVFMSSVPAVWSGLDKLHWLARRFPDWIFDVVGLEPKDTPGKPLPNLNFHGHLNRGKYEMILANADIAVSSLSLHCINVYENAPLKVREYMAYGLPCILAYQDSDFPQGANFILQIPNNQNNVIESAEEIEKFVLQWKGKRISRQAIRHLDVSVKEEQRLAFFHELTGLSSA